VIYISSPIIIIKILYSNLSPYKSSEMVISRMTSPPIKSIGLYMLSIVCSNPWYYRIIVLYIITSSLLPRIKLFLRDVISTYIKSN